MRNSHKSRLYSPVFSSPSSENCMIFRYNIWGKGKAGLKIYVENYENETDVKLHWNKHGPLAIDKWYTDSIDFNTFQMEKFRVMSNIIFKIFH